MRSAPKLARQRHGAKSHPHVVNPEWDGSQLTPALMELRGDLLGAQLDGRLSWVRPAPELEKALRSDRRRAPAPPQPQAYTRSSSASALLPPSGAHDAAFANLNSSASVQTANGRVGSDGGAAEARAAQMADKQFAERAALLAKLSELEAKLIDAQRLSSGQRTQLGSAEVELAALRAENGRLRRELGWQHAPPPPPKLAPADAQAPLQQIEP